MELPAVHSILPPIEEQYHENDDSVVIMPPECPGLPHSSSHVAMERAPALSSSVLSSLSAAQLQGIGGDSLDSLLRRMPVSMRTLRLLQSKSRGSSTILDPRHSDKQLSKSESAEDLLSKYNSKKSQYVSKLKMAPISLNTLRLLNNVKKIDSKIQSLSHG